MRSSHQDNGSEVAITAPFGAITQSTPNETFTGTQRASRIVVIDDDVLICESISGLVDRQHTEVQVFHDGSDAVLKEIRENPPDLIVTDVELPSRSGLEICSLLKGCSETSDVPIIVITAHTERSIRLQAIQHGATDFLLKPFDEEEVVLRIGNAIKSYRLLQETAATLQRLRQVEQMREELTGLVVHDLRAPIGSVRNYLELWLLKSSEPPGAALRQYIEVAFAQTGAVIDQIGTLLDISRIEAGAMPLIVRTCPMRDIFDRVSASVGAAALKRNIMIEADHGDFVGRVDADLVVRAIVNLTANAVRYAPAATAVSLSCARAGAGRFRVLVRDHGPGVPENVRGQLFTKFGAVVGRNRGHHSTGFGLYMCALVAKAHAGAVGYETPSDGGSQFWIELPDAHAGPELAAKDHGQHAESLVSRQQ